jgi:hypothetical protein
MARHRNDHELFDADKDECQIQEGTVGWPGSPEVTELGTESRDGVTLIRVTLARVGAPLGGPTADDGLANGYPILARPMGPGWRVPKRGERVVVLFPGGDWLTPGNAVILGTVGGSPSSKFGRKKTIQDYGDDDLVISAKTITLVVDRQDDGGVDHRHMLSVSQQGGVQVVSDGSGLFVKDGEVNLKTLDDSGNLKQALILTQSESSLTDYSTPGSTASLMLTGGKFTVAASFITLVYGTAGSFGKVGLTSPATPIVVGLTGQTGIGCTSLYGSPT